MSPRCARGRVATAALPPTGAASDLLQLVEREFVLDVAGVERRRRLEEEDVDLVVGHRPVLDAARHDEEFPLLQLDRVVPELQAEPALHDEEQLVLVLVVVPRERALELRQLDLPHELPGSATRREVLR